MESEMVAPDLGPRDLQVASFLAQGDAEHEEQIMDAFTAAAQPFTRGTSLQELSDAYTIASFWYAVSKDMKRRARTDGNWGDEEVLRAQLSEDYMEALVKALDKQIMTAMVIAKNSGGI